MRPWEPVQAIVPLLRVRAVLAVVRLQVSSLVSWPVLEYSRLWRSFVFANADEIESLEIDGMGMIIKWARLIVECFHVQQRHQILAIHSTALLVGAIIGEWIKEKLRVMRWWWAR